MIDRFAKRQKTASLKDERPVGIGRIIFVLCLLSLFLCPLHALTTEQEQQFTYYWYAARQAITDERFADAYALLEFCHMLKPDDPTTLMFLGVMYDGMNYKKLSTELFRQAFEADPRDKWYRYSIALLEQRTPEAEQEALRVLEKAYSVQKSASGKQNKPVDEDLLEQLKRMYISTKQWKKALAMQDELDEQRGYDGYSAITRYRIYAMWGKNKKAIEAIDKYLEMDPTNVQFLLFRMEIMEKTGAKKEDMYALFERILALEPYNISVLNNYAYYLSTHGGDLAEAERMSAITIREQPDNAVFLDTYGWILHLKGQDDLAKFYLNKALRNSNADSLEEIQKHINAIK